MESDDPSDVTNVLMAVTIASGGGRHGTDRANGGALLAV